MEKFIKKNWFKIAIPTLLVLVVFIYQYKITNTEFKSNTITLTNNKSCFSDGTKMLDSYKINNDTKSVIDSNFHFNQKLNKCFAHASIYPYQNCESGDIIFDVYENKEILTACFTTYGTINYVDSSKYPAEVIDQTDFIMRRNRFLELN